MYSELYDYVLSVKEKAEICDLEPSLQARAFLRIWSRKEALLKAAGIGIIDALSDLDVSANRSGHILPMLRHDGEMLLSKFAVRDVRIVNTHLTSLACDYAVTNFEVVMLTPNGLIS